MIARLVHFFCDGSYARQLREAEIARLEQEEIIGWILLSIIALLLVVLLALVIRLIIINKAKN